MATKYTTVEVWVMVDDGGDAVATHDPDRLAEMYEECVQEVSLAGGLRRVKLTVKVPLPTVIELTGEVTVDEMESGLTTTAA